MDIEVPSASPRTFSATTRHGRHIISLKTVLLSVYYPSAYGSEFGNDFGGYKDWSRKVWLPRARAQMLRGCSKFAELPQWPMMRGFRPRHGS